MDISIIGVPVDLGHKRRGVDMGVSAIRYTNLITSIQRLGYKVKDLGNINVPIIDDNRNEDKRTKHIDEVIRVSEELAEKVKQELLSGAFPIILGGDHSIAIGTIAGIFMGKGNCGLIYFDAHGNYDTPETTCTGNIHGMALAIANGHGKERLTNIGGVGQKIKPENTVLIGVRELGIDERKLLLKSGINVYTMKDIDKLGIAKVMEEAIIKAGRGTEGIHLSMDIDVVDPLEAPGVGSRVPGGLYYREAHFAMEILAESNTLISMDFSEVNPVLDEHNRTAILTSGLILSALGKKIL
jgi:arginase